jgi:redox-sensitive bicupin YhaK (pirin superfamily)
MLWNDLIPRQRIADGDGRAVEITVVAGRLGEVTAPSPPPSSWAARADSDVAIWTVKLAPGARFTLPAATADASRVLYFFRGEELRIAGAPVAAGSMIELQAGVEAPLAAGRDEVELLMLQGRPIGEPVVAHGPFVMNTREEIHDAIADYRRTQFGGWPWPSVDNVHGPDPQRFARRADGRLERPG